MNTMSVRLLYRPLRIGWCVADGDFASFRQAVRLSFTMWGGQYNPIIPVDDPKLADALIRLYRIDVLMNVSNAPAITTFINDYQHLPWPFLERELFVSSLAGGKRPLIADIRHPITRIWQEFYKGNVSAEPGLDIYEWDSADPLADVFACSFGALPSFAEIGVDYVGIARTALFGVPKIIPLGGDVAPLNHGRDSIGTLNRQFVNAHYYIRNHWDRPGFYIGDADNLLDLIHFWNLRAAAISLQFHDPRYADRMALPRRQMLEGIRQVAQPLSNPGGVSLWYRDERAVEDELAVFGQGLTCLRIGDGLWNGNNVRAPIMYFGEDHVLASVGSNRGKSSVSFSIPGKPFADTPENYNQRFVLSVYPVAALLDGDRETLHTPFIPTLNEFYGRHLHFIRNCVRVEPESIGIISSVADRSLTIRALDVTRLIAEIFATVGISATTSKAGLVATTLIRQMGGLDGCRVFKIAGVRALIENHRPDQSFDRGTAAQTIQAMGKDRPLSHYQSLYIEHRKPGTDLSKDTVLSYLLDRGVFRVGLKFVCPNCQLEFWMSLDDAGSRLECEYCGHGFNAAPQLRDKAWAFRRSGLFGRDDHQEGAIPVILTLQQLIKVQLDDKIFAPATKLELNGAAMGSCETDFIVVGLRGEDRKIDIVIGECKTRKPITADDVSNLTRVADAFPPEDYNVYVVFARLTPFSCEEVEFIKMINDTPYRQQRAIMFTQRELEPNFVYQETAEEFDIDKRFANEFVDMAIITDRVFFQKIRREVPGSKVNQENGPV
jgi:hypothetical protein